MLPHFEHILCHSEAFLIFSYPQILYQCGLRVFRKTLLTCLPAGRSYVICWFAVRSKPHCLKFRQSLFKVVNHFALFSRLCLKYAIICSGFMSAISDEILSRILRISFTASKFLIVFFSFVFIILFLLVNEFLMSYS